MKEIVVIIYVACVAFATVEGENVALSRHARSIAKEISGLAKFSAGVNEMESGQLNNAFANFKNSELSALHMHMKERVKRSLEGMPSLTKRSPLEERMKRSIDYTFAGKDKKMPPGPPLVGTFLY